MNISLSNESVRFNEKEKLKRFYRISENELKKYIEEGLKVKNRDIFILRKLELRLDNVIRRLGFAGDIEHARELIKHGHIIIDLKKIDSVNYHLSPKETIYLDKTIFNTPHIKEIAAGEDKSNLPGWLYREKNIGKVMHLPRKNEISNDINMNYVIEFYSLI